MEAWWMALLMVLCGFFVLLGLVVLGMLRQMGIIQRQLAETSPLNGLAPGTKAPDFSLPTPSGELIGLSAYRGRKVLLVFVSPGCGPCKRVLPDIVEALAVRRDQPDLLVISRDDRRANRELADGPARGLPLVYEEQPRVAAAYKVPGTPFACLVDEAGMIKSASIVAMREKVEQLLDGVTPLHVRFERHASQENGAVLAAKSAGVLKTQEEVKMRK